MEVVSHQAAYQDYVPDYSQFMSTNVVGTALMFEVLAARKLPVARIVVASSQAVYGEGQYLCPQHARVLASPRRLQDLEKGLWEVTCPECGMPANPQLLEESYTNPLSPYGTSKYAQEITALKLANLLRIHIQQQRNPVIVLGRIGLYRRQIQPSARSRVKDAH